MSFGLACTRLEVKRTKHVDGRQLSTLATPAIEKASSIEEVGRYKRWHGGSDQQLGDEKQQSSKRGDTNRSLFKFSARSSVKTNRLEIFPSIYFSRRDWLASLISLLPANANSRITFALATTRYVSQHVPFFPVLDRDNDFIHVQEGHVMKMLKILTAVREDLRNFYVPAWLNKVSQDRMSNSFQYTLVQERSRSVPATGRLHKRTI